MELFTLNDFKVFDLDGFSERMAAIATRIRPKLASIGKELQPKISELVDVPSDLEKIGDELTRRKDGHFVLGRRVDVKEFVKLDASHLEKIAVETFKSLAPLFQLHDARVVA